jgi:hypothetical protein
MKLTWSPKSNRFKPRMSTTGQVTCVTVRLVKIYRKKSGTDPEVAEGTTNDNGKLTIKVKKNFPAGSYYAVAPEVTVPDVTTCAEATSKLVKV